MGCAQRSRWRRGPARNGWGEPVTVARECLTVESVAVEDPGVARADATLLAGCSAGDQRAFAELYERHASWLVLRLSRRCSDAGVVDEVLQDTFVAVWRGAGRWDGRGPVAGWMWGIAVRRLVDATRRRPAATASLDELPEAAGRREPSAEDCALKSLDFGEVGAALSRLPRELGEVMRATVVDGLTTREAARLLGIPAGTVKTRMMRARALLRKELT